VAYFFGFYAIFDFLNGLKRSPAQGLVDQDNPCWLGYGL
jgi:hypothetical protein